MAKMSTIKNSVKKIHHLDSEVSLKSYHSKHIDRQIRLINEFLDYQKENYKQEGFLICLSGGVDSATLLKLVVDQYGPDGVVCLITFLDDFNSEKDIGDAKELCKKLGVSYFFVNITKPVDAMLETIPYFKTRPLDNVATRIRVSVAAAYAEKFNLRLLYAGPLYEYVISGNSLGTDIAHCYPLSGVYKSEIYAIADKIGLPRKFLTKVPSNSAEKGRVDKSKMFDIPFSKIEKVVAYHRGDLKREDLTIDDDTMIFLDFLMKYNERDVEFRALCVQFDLYSEDRIKFLREFKRYPFEGKNERN
ncbi:NAD(+) synthase [Nanoarchaeota archaeon]